MNTGGRNPERPRRWSPVRLVMLVSFGVLVQRQPFATAPIGLAGPLQVTATPVPVSPPGPWPTPRPSPTDSSDPEARALLLRSDEVMNAAGSMRIVGEDRWRDKPDQPPRSRVTYDFMAPDRAQWHHELSTGVFEAICIGRDYWTRKEGEPWTWERLKEPCEVPAFAHFQERDSGWTLAARDITFRGQEELAAGPAWVVGYRVPELSEEGWYDRLTTAWVDQRTERLLREEQWVNDPWGCQVCLTRLDYSRFGEAIRIEAPGPVPTAAPELRLFAPALGR